MDTKRSPENRGLKLAGQEPPGEPSGMESSGNLDQSRSQDPSAKFSSTQSQMEEDSGAKDGGEGFFPIVKIVWFSCLFFLALFSFYAWKFFITESAPRNLPVFVPIGLYILGILTYVVGETLGHHSGRPISNIKVPQEFIRMISFSMFEAVGLYGLVLAVFSQNIKSSTVFLLAALVGLIRHRPRD